MRPAVARRAATLALLALAATTASAAPIDSALFDGRGPAPRSFTKEIEIAASATAAYALWTDAVAWQAMMGPDSRAHIDLEIGGRYEWLFDGKVGSNGCQVLGYIPGRLVSFTWNAPPTLPTRDRRTWVVVETEALGEQATRVRLTHLGFGEGADWDATLAYFDSAWGYVLPLMKKHLEGGAK